MRDLQKLEMYSSVKDLLSNKNVRLNETWNEKLEETWNELICQRHWINCRRLELTWNVLIYQEPNEENMRDLQKLKMYSSVKDLLSNKNARLNETWNVLNY